jgi:chitin disaccharide deacetylase
LTTRLIINADDYGRSASISRGIRYAHLLGMVTSSTCMMNMPSVVDDIKIALKETPNLGLGVHLVLTSGKPLLPASKLPNLTAPDGRFYKPDIFINLAPSLDAAIIKEEWHAQIEKFISAAGKKPSHIDSHHHTSFCTPEIFKTFLEMARTYDIPIRLPLALGQRTTSAAMPEESTDPIAEFAPQLLEEFQPRSPDGFFSSFYDEQATRAEFMRILRLLLPNGCFEIMCHPGFVDEAFVGESEYSFQRQSELEVLTDQSLRKEVARLGIELISFAQL